MSCINHAKANTNAKMGTAFANVITCLMKEINQNDRRSLNERLWIL